MKSITCVVAAMLLLAVGAASAGELLDRSFRPLMGKQPVNLSDSYAGNVLMIVNTASKCGLAPQFEGLERLHSRYKAQGFAVLGFPSGDFRDQEFEDEEKIQEFCTLTYGVKFPMFERVRVLGDEATPLYRDLLAATGEAPAWNFHKYLVSREGKVIASFGSRTLPEDPAIVAAIEAALSAPRPASP